METAPERIFTLENDFIQVEFTSRGGAIRSVALKRFAAVQGESRPYVFNEGSKLPALGISQLREDGSLEQYSPTYDLLRLEDMAIEFHRELHPGIELVRRFELSEATEGADPYVLDHVSRFVNRTGTIYDVDHLFVNVGTAPPTASDPIDFFLSFSYYEAKDFETAERDFETIKVAKFTGSPGFLGFFRKDPVFLVRDPGSLPLRTTLSR